MIIFYIWIKVINLINYSGNALNYLGKFNEAIMMYNRAIELNPTNADTFYNKGNLIKTNF